MLAADEVRRQKAVSDRVTRNDSEQQAAIARRRREVKYYERQAVPRSTAVSLERSEGIERNRADRISSGSSKATLKSRK